MLALVLTLLFFQFFQNGEAANCTYEQMQEDYLSCLLDQTDSLLPNRSVDYFCSNHTDILHTMFSNCVISPDCLQTADQMSISKITMLLLSVPETVRHMVQVFHPLLCDSAHPCYAGSLKSCFKSLNFPGLAQTDSINSFLHLACMERYSSGLKEFYNCWTPIIDNSLYCLEESPQKDSVNILRILHGAVSLAKNSFPTVCSAGCSNNMEQVVDGVHQCITQLTDPAMKMMMTTDDPVAHCNLIKNATFCFYDTLYENQCQGIWTNSLHFMRSISYVKSALLQCSETLKDEPAFKLLESSATAAPEHNGHLTTKKPVDKEGFRTASLKPVESLDEQQVLIRTTSWPEKTKKPTSAVVLKKLKEIGGYPDVFTGGPVDKPVNAKIQSTIAPAEKTTSSAAPDDLELTISIVLSSVILAVVMASGI